MPYAVYVDENDIVWVSDFGANEMVRFDPQDETFEVLPFPRADANVRQILGRSGEVWGAESGIDRLKDGLVFFVKNAKAGDKNVKINSIGRRFANAEVVIGLT